MHQYVFFLGDIILYRCVSRYSQLFRFRLWMRALCLDMSRQPLPVVPHWSDLILQLIIFIWPSHCARLQESSPLLHKSVTFQTDVSLTPKQVISQYIIISTRDSNLHSWFICNFMFISSLRSESCVIEWCVVVYKCVYTLISWWSCVSEAYCYDEQQY